jgi:hypothetical protein
MSQPFPRGSIVNFPVTAAMRCRTPKPMVPYPFARSWVCGFWH